MLFIDQLPNYLARQLTCEGYVGLDNVSLISPCRVYFMLLSHR